jgi:hypothetical protein
MAATVANTYVPSFDTAPNIRQRIVTRATASAGEITALGTAPAVLIVEGDGTNSKNEILAAIDAIRRRVARDFAEVTSTSDMDTVGGASFE